MNSLAPNSLSAPPTPAAVGLCKFGQIQTNAPFWGAEATQGGYTGSLLITAESEFDWVRVLFQNMDATNPSTINSVSVAATAGVGDTVNPIDATGAVNTGLWAPAYFNNGGAGGFPLDMPTGTTRNLVLPAATQNAFTGGGTGNIADRTGTFGFTDWLSCTSLTQLDGSLPKLLVRSYGGQYTSNVVVGGVLGQSPVGGGAWDTYAQGRIIRTSVLTGDQATTPGVATPNPAGYMMPMGVQFLSRKRGLNTMALGDSEIAAAGTLTGQNNPFAAACKALSTPSFPISYHSMAHQSMSHESYIANARAMLKLYRPDVLFIKGYSPNDGATVAALQKGMAYAFALAAWCEDNDIVPILVTAEAFTVAGNPVAFEAYRQTVYNPAIRNSRFLFVDMDAALSSSGSSAITPAAVISAANPPHYGDAGTTAVVPYVKQPLQRVIDARPRRTSY